MRLKAIYFCGLVLAVIALAIVITASAAPWYVWEDAKGGSVQEFATKASSDDYGDCVYTNSECGFGEEWKMMYNLIFVFLMLSLVLSLFITGIFFVFSFSWFGKYGWLTRLRIPLILATLFFLATSTVSWCLLFMHPSALNHYLYVLKCREQQLMQATKQSKSKWPCSIDGDQPYCSFLGSKDTYSWGPTAGWGLMIAVTGLSLPIIIASLFGGAPASNYEGIPLINS